MMPAGQYYVGDLCYVMDDEEWDQFCKITINGNKCLEGEFQMPDGRMFATYGTAWGDGLYFDQHGNEYAVDAGLIGCIRVEDIHADKYDNLDDLGTIHTFKSDFITSGGRGNPNWNGAIQFGSVAIETDPRDDYYD